MTETIIIDVIVPGVGRIKRASGTTRKPIVARIKRMVRELTEDGRLDLLAAVRDSKMTWLELFNAYQRKELHLLPTAGDAQLLVPAWASWVNKKECSDEHKRSIRKTIKYLDPRSDALVNDVSALLEVFRVKAAGKPQTFRLARSHCLAFVKAQLKRSHPLYLRVAEIEPMKPRPKKIKHPATVAELRAIGKKMVPFARDILWSLAVTGMRPNEYWGQWNLNASGGIAIQGTKTKGALRLVPYLSVVRLPPHSYTVFRKVLNKASDGQMSVYDLRRTYANWLEAAGIPRTRRRLYLGHGNSDVSDLYEWHDVQAFLSEDAAKLLAFIAKEEPYLRLAK